MSFPKAPSDPKPRTTLASVFIDGFASCACAIYPTAAGIEILAEIQERQSGRFRDLAGNPQKHSEALRRPARPRDQRSFSMHERVQDFLRQRWVGIAARTLLTLPFWASGIAKLVAFDSGVAEMAHHGLEPAILFNVATIATQLVGSALIIANRGAWLGAGALGVFTGLTIVLVHRFWEMPEGITRTIAFHAVVEHIGIVGGLLGVAVLSARCASRSARVGAPCHKPQHGGSS